MANYIETVSEAGRLSAELAWESLVPESDVDAQWNDSADEPWHCLSLDRAEFMERDDCEDLTAAFTAAAAARWRELCAERDDRMAAFAACCGRVPALRDRFEEKMRDEPGSVDANSGELRPQSLVYEYDCWTRGRAIDFGNFEELRESWKNLSMDEVLAEVRAHGG